MTRRLIPFTAVATLLTFLTISACRITGHPPSGRVAANGNALHYEMHGHGHQTLVLIHGWSNSLHLWDQQIEPLSNTFRVVTVDLPGFGDSKNHRNTWTMSSFGADVAAVIDHLGLKDVILVGFSMGGPVSIETAKHARPHVMGVVLVDVIQNPEEVYPEEVIRNMAATYMDTVTHPTTEKVKLFFKTNQEELSKKYIAMIKDVPKVGWEASLTNCFNWLNKSAAASIKRLDLPILAINADQQPTETAIFRKYNPHFKARIIKGVNHVVLWESPEQFTRYLRESIDEIKRLNGKS